MKKTIAAILVTILASAGFVVLDKTSVEKIDRMASQVSSQQEAIDNYVSPADPIEMQTGGTLRCYPAAGETVQAYVFDPSRTTTWTYDLSTTMGEIFTTQKAEATTSTTRPETCTTAPAETTYPSTTYSVRAQWDELTAPTAEPTRPTAHTTMPSSTAKPTITAGPTIPATRSPDSYFYENQDYYYHLRADVRITTFKCEMIRKTMTRVPEFSVILCGKVDPSFSGRVIMVYFGDDLMIGRKTASGTIQADGSFSVSAELVLANPTVVPLYQIRID